MVISFIFSYLENFFVLFYLCFYFILAPDGSARDPDPGWVILEFAGREWCTVSPPPPQGGNRRPLGGGWTWGGGEGMCFSPYLGVWGGGGLPRGLGHNLLM